MTSLCSFSGNVRKLRKITTTLKFIKLLLLLLLLLLFPFLSDTKKNGGNNVKYHSKSGKAGRGRYTQINGNGKLYLRLDRAGDKPI